MAEHVLTGGCTNGVPFDTDDRFVVYTCVTNDYDVVLPVEVSEVSETFVCFTDQPKKVPSGWTGRPLQSPARLKSGHDINRFHKLFPHRLFPGARYSIYIDGNISFRFGYDLLIDKLRSSGAALGAFSHPDSRTVYDESVACVNHGKLDSDELKTRVLQLDRYRDEGFDLSEVVTANYLLVRDHGHPKLETAMSLWWSHLFEFTKRDQLSLNYVLWQTGLPWVYLDSDLGLDASGLVRYPHHRRTWKKAAKRIGNTARKLAGYFG